MNRMGTDPATGKRRLCVVTPVHNEAGQPHQARRAPSRRRGGNCGIGTSKFFSLTMEVKTFRSRRCAEIRAQRHSDRICATEPQFWPSSGRLRGDGNGRGRCHRYDGFRSAAPAGRDRPHGRSPTRTAPMSCRWCATTRPAPARARACFRLGSIARLIICPTHPHRAQRRGFSVDQAVASLDVLIRIPEREKFYPRVDSIVGDFHRSRSISSRPRSRSRKGDLHVSHLLASALRARRYLITAPIPLQFVFWLGMTISIMSILLWYGTFHLEIDRA